MARSRFLSIALKSRRASSAVKNLMVERRWAFRAGDMGLSPAHQLKDGDNHVAGAAFQAPDNPVAGVGFGRAGELFAAMGTVVDHGSLGLLLKRVQLSRSLGQIGKGVKI